MQVDVIKALSRPIIIIDTPFGFLDRLLQLAKIVVKTEIECLKIVLIGNDLCKVRP